MSKERQYIYHIDMDSFFTSVEISLDPSLKGKPVIISGRQNGVVSSASYEARKLGVKSGMPSFVANKLSKKLQVVVPTDKNMERYREISQQIFSFLRTNVSRTIEVGSIDEWYLDTSKTKYAHLGEKEVAQIIKSGIKEKFGLNCTVGCSFTKFLAKMATNLGKPDGFYLLTKENFKKEIWDFPIEKMIMVGKKNRQELLNLGIKKISDIVSYKNDDLASKIFGVNWQKYKNNALGISNSEVIVNSQQKSFGKSKAFSKELDAIEIKALGWRLCDEINESLTYQELVFQGLTCGIKLLNGAHRTRSETFKSHQAKVTEKMYKSLINKLLENISCSQVRNVNISLFKIEDRTIFDEQLNWIEEPHQVTNPLDEVIMKVNKKLKKRVLYKHK